MITVRRANDRGSTSIGWLNARHSFSFGRYHDPEHTSFGALRVINDDRIAPGRGFDEHPHRDMEIISYIVEGRLAHKDSTGNAREVGPGGVQRMSAGRGVFHSEFNPSKTEGTRLLQIWIFPEARGLDPSYEDIQTPVHTEPGRLHVIASRRPEPGQALVHQDVTLRAGVLRPGDADRVEPAEGRRAWVQVVRGALRVNGEPLAEGDGAAIEGERLVEIEAGAGGVEVLVFDLA